MEKSRKRSLSPAASFACRIQDQIVVRVVGAIAPQLEKAEIARANGRATERLVVGLRKAGLPG
jgi:hypothetical protein